MSRVLVIDDESIVGVILRYAFDEKGHETVVASDGRAGIEMARAEHPDAIVLDLMMPGVNGYDVLGAFRRFIRARGSARPRLDGSHTHSGSRALPLGRG